MGTAPQKLQHSAAQPGSAATSGNITVSVRANDYEKSLSDDGRWALSEASRHFDEKSSVFAALVKITKKIEELGIPYAVVNGMALFKHGFRRFTEDVDILVTKQGLKQVHAALDGLGYVPAHKHSKHLRDTENGVRIEFLTTGEYPGDGKEKPVAFPDPATVADDFNSIKYINLPRLIDLKLASGMTAADRLKDLADVLELIKLLDLPAEFAEQLNPYVQPKFRELWRQSTRRFVKLWRNKWLTSEARSIEEMIKSLRQAGDELEAMRRDGVILSDIGSVGDDYAYLSTTDSAIAKKYDMVEESEYWPDDEEDEETDTRPTA